MPTPKARRLTILIDPCMTNWPEVVRLRELGHTVLTVGDLLSQGIGWNSLHLVLSPLAWRMRENGPERKHFQTAIRAAQIAKGLVDSEKETT